MYYVYAEQCVMKTVGEWQKGRGDGEGGKEGVQNKREGKQVHLTCD
jgi:hypothetical protein